MRFLPQGCARFTENLSELTKTWSSGATECRVWIGNCNVKVWKSTEHKLHNIWRSVKFQQNEHTPVSILFKIMKNSKSDESWGVLVLLVSVQILVRLDCFSHSITMEVWKPARWKRAKFHRNEHTPGFPSGVCSFC